MSGKVVDFTRTSEAIEWFRKIEIDLEKPKPLPPTELQFVMQPVTVMDMVNACILVVVVLSASLSCGWVFLKVGEAVVSLVSGLI